MSTLIMGDAEYGRDQSQIKILITELNTKADSILKNVDSTSQEFKNVISAVEACWAGADATKFLNEFKSKNSKVANDLKTLKSKITNVFYEDEKQFAKFQASNDIVE